MCVEHNNNVCDIFKEKSKDYVFVRYYEVMREEKVLFYSVEKNLKCIQLVWERYINRTDGQGVGNEYALCPLAAV